MPIQLQGSSGVMADVGGTGFRALKVQQMPPEYGSFGIYRLSMLSGTMAAGLTADSEIYQFRWTDATRLCLVRRIQFDGLSGSATGFAAGFGRIYVTAARSFSAAGTGGTAATITGNNQKVRTSMGTTLLGEARCASTAALTAGTKTLDSQAFGQISLSIGTAVSTQWIGPTILFGEDPGPEHPLVLAQNEGFAIRAVVPGTGTWQFGISVTWAEVAAY
jgi:hypothetical protein